MSLGDAQVEKYNDSVQNITAWILMVMCTLITNIVMLNLLIAIISQSFERINEVSTLANY